MPVSTLERARLTCNCDGAYKHRTVIGDDVFIGSDTQLVAPVTIAEGATIGAGSTITRNVDAQALALSRSETNEHLKLGTSTKIEVIGETVCVGLLVVSHNVTLYQFY